jgi:hypothetical protein
MATHFIIFLRKWQIYLKMLDSSPQTVCQLRNKAGKMDTARIGF